MIRALYTAASGMTAQQANIDNVAHNLANVNTSGFKKARVEFEDLVYDKTKTAGSPTSASAETPVGLETGLGVRAVATSRDFARASAGAGLEAMRLARAGETAFSFMRPPGHHATQNRAMGFCYLSNMAIAAPEALATGAK